jgi:capsular polysaccharide biosynthesis protein
MGKIKVIIMKSKKISIKFKIQIIKDFEKIIHSCYILKQLQSSMSRGNENSTLDKISDANVGTRIGGVAIKLSHEKNRCSFVAISCLRVFSKNLHSASKLIQQHKIEAWL